MPLELLARMLAIRGASAFNHSKVVFLHLVFLQVNIIPIIAKSDAISKSELTKFKIKITSELVSNGVQIYQFPTDDESVSEINGTMNVSKKMCYFISGKYLFLGGGYFAK